jgi:RNA polymerase sigma-70 factor (ECF subfamily)
MATELIEQAKAGDAEAFRELTDPYRRDLQVHCYRILGSLQDAEDALQDTMLAAWQGLGGFEGRSSLRTWLYRVATSRCLNALRAARRRPRADFSLPDVELPEPSGQGEVPWLEPYPDILLDGTAGSPQGPEARYESTESISLAFIIALQLLPPRQRAVLILRDVLGFHAAEVATMLDSTVESVTSALKRARATLQRRDRIEGTAPPANSPEEVEIVARLTRAYQTGDVDGVVALLTDDVRIAMPPLPLEYEGRDLAARFHRAVTFREGRTYYVVPTRANGQPALAAYVADPRGGPSHAVGLFVLSLSGAQISAITRFHQSVLPGFGLPRVLPPTLA